MAVRKLVVSVLVGVHTLYGSVSAGQTAQEILEKVRRKYDSIEDARFDFSQKITFSMTMIEQTMSGTLFLKKTNKYRLELDDQTIVTNGRTVWKYSMPQNQVIIDTFKMNERSLSPERILAGAPEDFFSTLLGKGKIGKSDVVSLKLVPKSDDSLIKSLKLWIDESSWLIRKVELLDVNEKQTVYLVNDVKINVGLQDSYFTYQIPDGSEVVDLR